MKPINYGRQFISIEDLEAVEKVLTGDYLTQGPCIKEFEEKFAEYIGCKYAVAVANGTAALHLSALALNKDSQKKVITTPITFAASANCIRYIGAEVDFVDIDPDTYLMDLNKLEQKLINSPQETYQGIVPVDFAGYPVNMEKLKNIADKHKLWILEDACHAPGAYFSDSDDKIQKSGNNVYSDAAIYSFHPVKHIATGEGGMITTNCEELYKKLILLRTHGITKNAEEIESNHPAWYYEMQELGFNYRLSDIHAALGLSQLTKAHEGLQKRNEIAKRYNEAFENTQLKVPFIDNQSYHAFHLYVVQTNKRNQLYEYLKQKKIFTQVHYIPVHLHPYYKKQGWAKGDFPLAEKYYEQCLSLPMYPTLSVDEQNYVIDHILSFLNNES